MLNTDHLLTFVTIVDFGTYSAAAEHLHMTQPAITRQMRQLEKQLGGVRLFRRVGQRMQLTHAGEELLPTARELLALAERAEEAMLALRGHITGRVTIASGPGGGGLLLAELLAELRLRLPAIQVALEVGPPELLPEWLDEGRAQLLLSEEPLRRRGWESTLLASEPLIGAASSSHPLASQELLTIGMLREQELILPRRSTPTRRQIEDALRRKSVGTHELHITLETDSAETALQAVRAGLGLTFVPASTLRRQPDLVALSFSGLRLTQEWHLVRLRDGRRAAQECAAFLTSSEAAATLERLGL